MSALGLAFVILFAATMIAYAHIVLRRYKRDIRTIPAFDDLQRAIELAVEDGTRLHLTLGHSDMTGARSAAGLVGLSTLKKVLDIASQSDKPPIATAGDGTLGLLAQDVLRTTYTSLGKSSSYELGQSQVTGITPFSYAAGAIPVVRDEDASANLMLGSFGPEVALISSATARTQSFTLAGADNLPAQAILYASANRPLIGEELYAAGAYMDAGPMHTASLHVQDIFRWLLIFAIFGGALFKLLGILQ